MSALVLCWTVGSAVGCVSEEPEPVGTVIVTQELDVHWELLPHRVSAMELTLDPTQDTSGTVRAFNDGGSFGFLDTPGVRYGLEVWQSRKLRSHSGSVTVELPPGSEVDGEPFAVRVTVELPVGPDVPGDLVEPGAMAVLLRGYAIDTDSYETPPDFATDPDLPYDPAHGYTTQGIGIRLGPPSHQMGNVAFDVTVRNSLGLADRGDMNAAIPQATTWVRVDYVLVSVLDGGTAVRSEVSYNLSTAEYGQGTVHPHAPMTQQQLLLQGEPGVAQALFGISGFDLWVNVDGHKDPGCIVTQDATNAWDEPISGPGRYLTELGVRLWETQYDAATGQGEAHLDLHLSNTSASKEVGNLCVGARGEVVMLQLDDPEAVRIQVDPVEYTFEAGGAGSREVVW